MITVTGFLNMYFTGIVHKKCEQHLNSGFGVRSTFMDLTSAGLGLEYKGVVYKAPAIGT